MKTTKRRDFIKNLARGAVLAGIAGVCGMLGLRKNKYQCSGRCGTCKPANGGVCPLDSAAGSGFVWQLDPEKCTQCGRCATHCVLAPSAVKCFHSYSICGYCDLCGGYLRPDAKERNTGAENQLCPTAAIRRKFIEDPYYQYTIDEELCIGCGKCVRGCSTFGNGSLYLQVKHNLCVNCNECAIARACPSDAFRRVPASEPYLLKSNQEKRIS
ncbi:MAG TPA: 4Fe-4S binding protein [Pontiellaceae bacterium]|nr:4Fe-4S binding protein [Pontiellaceae bacterium]HPR83252.1 4Fe-4S binding protein [Pontiellaceae bacterium]